MSTAGMFRRPGTMAPAVGVSVDREADVYAEGDVVVYNPSAHLPLAQQRQALPIEAHRTTANIAYGTRSADWRQAWSYSTRSSTIRASSLPARRAAASRLKSRSIWYRHAMRPAARHRRVTLTRASQDEAGWTRNAYRVACSQPRALAAATIAGRVAQEMGLRPSPVAHAVPFDSTVGAATRIVITTDAVLLKEVARDPLLTAYSVVMVDEAHERSLQTDALLGLLYVAFFSHFYCLVTWLAFYAISLSIVARYFESDCDES